MSTKTLWIIVFVVNCMQFEATAETPIEDGSKQDWSSDIEIWRRNVTTPTLTIDTAWLHVKSLVSSDMQLWWQHGKCEKCPLKRMQQGSPGGVNHTVYRIQTKFDSQVALHVQYNSSSRISICSGRRHFREGGDYWLIASDTSVDWQCHLVLMNDPPNNYLPILWAFLILVGLATIWTITTLLFRKGYIHKPEHYMWKGHSLDLGSVKQPVTISTVELVQSTEIGDQSSIKSQHPTSDTIIPVQTTKNETEVKKTKRLVFLDTFRGLCLVVMIFVNYGGGSYTVFSHAVWNGLLVADLVFPWFVFLMGMSMAFSFKGQLRRKTPKWKMAYKVIKRSVLLFFYGFALFNTRGPVDLKTVRIPNVLQRFSITYLVLGLMEVFFAKLPPKSTKGKKCSALFGDIIDFWPEWILNFGLLSLFLGLTYGLPVPGCPTGYVGPGGLHDGGKHFNCTGGAAGYIDKIILTAAHLYQWPTSKTIFGADGPFDPEGILGSLTSVFICFLGLQAGKIIVYHTSVRGRIIRWLIWGVLTGGLGLFLCGAQEDGGWVPMNKNLWSLSFILVLAGMGYFALALMYIIQDVFGLWNGAPFIYPGMNSIVIYLCHSVFGNFFPIKWQVEAVHWKLLALHMWGTALWIVVAYILYRKKIFIAL